MTRRVVISAVFLALLLGYVAFDRWWSDRKETRKKEETLLFNVKADDLIELSVQREKEAEIRLAKAEDGAWRLTAPVEDLADDATVKSMRTKLEEAQYERVIAEQADNPAAFGLDPHKIRVAFRAKGQTEPSFLLLGEKTPIGYNHYAQRGDEPRVLLVSSAVKSVFDRDVFSLRNKEVLKLDREKVQAIRFQNEKTEGETKLRRSGETWVLDADPTLDLDQETVKNLVRDLANLRIREFSDEHPGDPGRYGLSKPSASYAIEWESPQGVATETVEIGRAVKDKERFYARQASRATVFELDKYSVDNLRKSPSNLIQKRPLRFSRFDVTAVDLTTPKGSFAFEKKDGEWRVTQPGAGKAKKDLVSNLLRFLDDAEASDIQRGVKPEFGLDSPRLRIVLKEGATTHPPLLVGARVDRDGKAHAYLKNDQKAVAYLVPSEDLERLLPDLEDPREPVTELKPEGAVP
ncbi:MAG: DUF4340 domain-containing protein [Nitrospirae bacterium]|nr:DUF4340 domain-containing protein [Nitrospirota bacterium]